MCGTISPTADANNHLPLWGYDSSGDATSDGFVTNYQWDGENQLTSAAGVTHIYDGDGKRVQKSNGKLYWYGLSADPLDETDSAGNTNNSSFNEYIFFGGKRIAMLPASDNPTYYVEDLLGTSRVLTSSTGVPCRVSGFVLANPELTDDADFYPYGGERPYLNTCPQNYKFESKERDAETGNDDFGARYYSNRFGRWLSADWSSVPVPVPYANLTNPQTLNLYSMVADDPETFADLDGHCCVVEAAEAGAEFGELFGPVGEAIGAAVGAVTGAFLGDKAATAVQTQSPSFAIATDEMGAMAQGMNYGSIHQAENTQSATQSNAQSPNPAAGQQSTPAQPEQPSGGNDLKRSSSTKQTGTQGQKTETTVRDPSGSTTYKTEPGKTGGQSSASFAKTLTAKPFM